MWHIFGIIVPRGGAFAGALDVKRVSHTRSHTLTDIPLGYGIFCSAFDFVVAAYLMVSNTAWHEPGKLDPYFWRHIARADDVIE